MKFNLWASATSEAQAALTYAATQEAKDLTRETENQDHIQREIPRRVWRAVLPISRKLFLLTLLKTRGGAWRERPEANGETFYFARGWALADAFGLNIAALGASTYAMEDASNV